MQFVVANASDLSFARISIQSNLSASTWLHELIDIELKRVDSRLHDGTDKRATEFGLQYVNFIMTQNAGIWWVNPSIIPRRGWWFWSYLAHVELIQICVW